MTSTSPALTDAPAATLTSRMLPGMGALTVTAPAAPAGAAALGAAAGAAGALGAAGAAAATGAGKNIGFVFQFFNLVPELTAKENIFLPMMIDKVKVDEEYFDKLTEKLGISERLTHYPSQLSGGQQQRVAIARALIHKPKVLLCDEPTGNLDSQSGKEVLRLLRELQSEDGQTIIMVTHDGNIADQADRIVRIEDGQIKCV